MTNFHVFQIICGAVKNLFASVSLCALLMDLFLGFCIECQKGGGAGCARLCLNLYLSLLLYSVVKNCSVLSTPSNGLKNTNSISCGTVVDFSCNECYELEGNEQLSCLSNTSWSGGNPRCNCKVCIDCLRLSLIFVTLL